MRQICRRFKAVLLRGEWRHQTAGCHRRLTAVTAPPLLTDGKFTISHHLAEESLDESKLVFALLLALFGPKSEKLFYVPISSPKVLHAALVRNAAPGPAG